MDALDEFFRQWCEPEAWCERCGAYPAVHVIVHDDQEPYGSIVTFVQIWDAETQTHIAVCRRCSSRLIEALGTPKFQHSPEPEHAERCVRQQHFWRSLGRYLKRWQTCLMILLGGRPHRSQKREESRRYSRIGS